MAEKIKPHFIVKEERIGQLKQLFPEAFGDGRINWDALKEALGEFLEDDSQEHFGLNWPGKKEARKMAFLPPRGTLKLAQGEGIDEETTENLFIEGDNLEVLKLLQKSYFGKIKMIYIDPPYNTGNDFVYSDDFTDTIDDYLRKTGQLDSEGKALSTNPKTAGRFHSNWLNMMYPRLLLAKNLLRDDGVIFVSIDDNEVHNLKQVMNEIYGEENFVSTIIWKKTYGGGSKSKYIVGLHEYILCFARNISKILVLDVPPNPEMRKYYTGKDEKYDNRGPYRTQPLATNSMDDRPNLRFPIIWEGNEIWPEKQWQWSKERVQKALKDNELIISQNKDKWSVRYKQYLINEDGNERTAKLFSIFDGPYTQVGTNEIKELFGNGKIFTFPKPSLLLKSILALSWNDNDCICLDFFAGSAPTACSLFELNKDDNGKRRLIMIQLPEAVAKNSEAHKAGYTTIAEIGKERIRRVIKKLNSEDNNTHHQDRGFKVLKLSESNIIKWEEVRTSNLEDLEKQLFDFTEPLQPGWKKEDLLLEVLLWEGFALTSKMEKKKAGQNTFVSITDKTMEYKLWTCFDKKLEFTVKEFAALGFAREDVIVFLDSSLTDATKSRLSDLCRLKVV